MTVSQRSVFIGQDTRLDSNPDSINYFGVWTSDGATASEATQLTAPAGDTDAGLSSISTAAVVPGSLVFAVADDPSGPLFATDPVSGLPVELSVPSLPTSDTPMDATSISSLVLFSAQDSTGASDLWRTDGTAAGTFALVIPAGLYLTQGGGLSPTNITAFAAGALFVGSSAEGSSDLFFTDGTGAGTRQLMVLSGPGEPAELDQLGRSQGPSDYFDPIGVIDGRLLFLTTPSGGAGSLLSTDGTTTGTLTLASLDDVGDVSAAPLDGRNIYSSAGALFTTDGSAAGSTELVAATINDAAAAGIPDYFAAAADAVVTVDAYDLTALGNKVVFGVYVEADGASSSELYVTDGTATGTQVIEVSHEESGLYGGFSPGDLTAFGSHALFDARDAVGTGTAYDGADVTDGLWITDGTAAGTVEIAPGTDPSNIVALANGLAEFSGTDGLYVTDGTAVGTHLIAATGAAADGLAPTTIYAVPSPLGFTGVQAQYDLAPDAAGALQARDLVGGRDGSIVAPDARVLNFGDGSTALFDASGNAEAVARIYLAAYDRAPDMAGLSSYTQQADAGTVSLAQIAAAAPASAQFLSTYGALSNAQFVTQLYENADGRAPDPGGLAAYTGALAAGQTRGEVLLAIAESPEARLHGIAVAGNADDATVARLYEAINARAPDPGGQITYATALDNGQSVQQIAAAMLAGPEYAAEFGNPGNAAFVTDLYANLLGRAPDPAGLASYTADLAGGQSRAQLVAGFVGSDEARLVTAPLTHQGYVSVI